MTEQKSAVPPVPEHLHTITPRLVVRGGAGAIEFYRAAFAAEEVGERFVDPSGAVIHAEMRIGGSVVHTGATLAAQTGATLAELMSRLGHSTPRAALRYQHATQGRDAEIARRLSAMASEQST